MTLDQVEINGDIIEFNGDEVARINPKFTGSSRKEFEDAVCGGLGKPKGIHGLLDDLLVEAKEKSQAEMITIEELELILNDVRNSF